MKNLDDPEFRQMYQESKALKKKYGEFDKNTMYSVAGYGISGWLLNEMLSGKTQK